MEFHQKRRQIFLGEDYYHQQLLLTETVIDGPEGLKANLLIPETESGWHASLKGPGLRARGRSRGGSGRVGRSRRR